MKPVCLLYAVLCASTSLCVMTCSKHSQELSSNKDKPLIFFNRLPSNPKTGVIDIDTMHWNNKTYYVGSDALGGGIAQGELITEYLAAANPSIIDRNGDGTIGYVLCIGDTNHLESKARTEGIRKALGTWVGSTDPTEAQQGIISIAGKTFAVEELAAQEMIGEDGTTWNAGCATHTMSNWIDTFADQIDMVISNNDSMAMGCLQAPHYPLGLPIFGYDATPDALKAIGKTIFTGTVTQNADTQAFLLLQILRNIFDGYMDPDVYTKGITEPNTYGNCVSIPIQYHNKDRTFIVKNSAVTIKNYRDYMNDKHNSEIKQMTSKKKKVLVSIYDKHDFFLSHTYKPALQYYAPLLNIDLTIIEGDGVTESSCLKQFTNLDNFDAYIVNMVDSRSGPYYTKKLK